MSIGSRGEGLLRVAESIVHDVRFGARVLWKNSTVTVVAVLSLSLAIGACTASFSLIDALILRPLPVADPARLINVVHRPAGEAEDSTWFNYPLFERMRDAAREHVQLFGMSYPSRRDAIFDDGDRQPEKVYAQWISGDALPILGVKAERPDRRLSSAARCTDRVQFRGPVRRRAVSGQLRQAGPDRSRIRPGRYDRGQR